MHSRSTEVVEKTLWKPKKLRKFRGETKSINSPYPKEKLKERCKTSKRMQMTNVYFVYYT